MAKRLATFLFVAALVPIGSAAAFEWSEGRVAAPVSPRPGRFKRTLDASRFLKGNLHTHSNRSDGDSPPEEVVKWYRQHGYAFLAVTDHNRFFDARRWSGLEGDAFRLLSGEEVSMKGGGKQVHVNALCTTRRIGGGTFSSVTEALRWATSQIEAQGGVVLVNHPNFDRALEPGDLLAIGGSPLLEVMSGHPFVFSEGAPDRPSVETLWDGALHEGADFIGVAVDDTHHLHPTTDPPASPGRGWVQVFADRSDPQAICGALREGNLYASTGVALSRIRVTSDTYTVWVETPGSMVSFVGDGGRILLRAEALDAERGASYALRGGEGYVRARIDGPDGSRAWTPALFASEEGSLGLASRVASEGRK